MKNFLFQCIQCKKFRNQTKTIYLIQISDNATGEWTRIRFAFGVWEREDEADLFSLFGSSSLVSSSSLAPLVLRR